MRVLVFSSLYPNQVSPQLGLFVQRRAEAVAGCGVEMQVVAPVPYFPRVLPVQRWKRYADVPARERVGTLAVTHPRYLHGPGPGMYVQAANLAAATSGHLRALRRQFDFQLLDAHYIYPDGVAAVRLARSMGIPCVLTARGSDINLLPQHRLVRRQISQALRHADALVAVSGALADRMRELGAPSERLHVIPNGIERRHFHYGEQSAARERLRIYTDEKMLLSVGNLNELKGHALVLDAISRLQARGIRASYHVFGEGEERPRLEAQIAALGLGDRVVLHGNLRNERLRPWYQAASLFVLASSREGWPNVLNEALACGAPCVATAVGGVPEILQHGHNGLLVERSVESIAGGIEAGLARRWDRSLLAREASRTSWSDVAARLVEMFTRLTGGRPVPPALVPEAADEPVPIARP